MFADTLRNILVMSHIFSAETSAAAIATTAY